MDGDYKNSSFAGESWENQSPMSENANSHQDQVSISESSVLTLYEEAKHSSKTVNASIDQDKPNRSNIFKKKNIYLLPK